MINIELEKGDTLKLSAVSEYERMSKNLSRHERERENKTKKLK